MTTLRKLSVYHAHRWNRLKQYLLPPENTYPKTQQPRSLANQQTATTELSVQAASCTRVTVAQDQGTRACNHPRVNWHCAGGAIQIRLQAVPALLPCIAARSPAADLPSKHHASSWSMTVRTDGKSETRSSTYYRWKVHVYHPPVVQLDWLEASNIQLDRRGSVYKSQQPVSPRSRAKEECE